MKIGDLAETVGISVETIRFYEQKGLMPAPSRTTGNFRDYTDTHVQQLFLIRHCRALDMSHQEIQVILECLDEPEGSCLRVNNVLDEHIAHVAQRISDLQALKQTLDNLRRRCGNSATVEDCGIVQGLAMPELRTLPKRTAHIKLSHR